MGGVNIDFAETAPNKSHHDQCAPNQQRHCIDIVYGRNRSRKEQRLAEGVNPRSEHNPEAKNDKLDPPLHRPNS
jgi:hypothetical protein